MAQLKDRLPTDHDLVKREFAIQHDMITPDELAALKRKDAHMPNQVNILNLNAELPYPTGATRKLYHGRASDIAANRLLGLPYDHI